MSGTPRQKTSAHLIEGEAYRRIMSGQAPETLTEFSDQLLAWFQQTQPTASPLTVKEVEEQISATWHRRHELIRGG